MERDSFSSNGVGSVIRDRFCEQSDKYVCHMCKTCGLIATYNISTEEKHCTVCKTSGDDISRIQLPYTTKLLFQDLMAMVIATRIMTNEFVK